MAKKYKENKKSAKKYIIWAALLTLLLVLVFLNPFCGPKISSELGEPFIHTPLGYSVNPPKGWELETGDKKDAKPDNVVNFIAHKHFPKPTGLEIAYYRNVNVVPEKEEELQDVINMHNEKNRLLFMNNDYAEVLRKYVAVKREEKKGSVEKKIPVLIFKTIDGIETYMHYQAYIIDGQDALVLTFNTHESEFEKYIPLFDAVVGSVKWLNTVK